jgi:outer membrane protein assembly factor BamB
VRKVQRLLLLLACAALCLPLAGCFGWFSSQPPKHPPAALTEIESPKNVRQLWSVSVGSAETGFFAPALSYDVIYAAGADGTVSKIDASNGNVIWRKDLDTNLIAGVGSDGQTVAVVAEKGILIALGSDGQEKWRAQLSTEATASPIVSKGVVVARSMDNRISAYDAETGERRWVVPYRLPGLMLRHEAGMAAVGPTVVVATPGGKMISMMLNNGAIRWEVPVGLPKGTSELERLSDMTGVPVIFGQGVCVTAWRGRIGCFDVVSGNPFWVKDFASKVGVSIDQDYVYGVDQADKVYAFANTSGHSVWRNEKLTYRSLSSPTAFLSTVVVGDYDGYVHFLSRFDGTVNARVSTDGSPIVAAPVAMSDRVIIQTTGGSLRAFALD